MPTRPSLLKVLKMLVTEKKENQRQLAVLGTLVIHSLNAEQGSLTTERFNAKTIKTAPVQSADDSK